MNQFKVEEITEEDIMARLLRWDEKYLIPHCGDAIALIEANPFSKRLKYLIKRQDLSGIAVKMLSVEWKLQIA